MTKSRIKFGALLEYKNMDSRRKLILPIIVSLSLIFIILIGIMYLDANPATSKANLAYRGFISPFIIIILPTAPIIYGWITKDRTGAMFVGIAPLASIIVFGALYAAMTSQMRLSEVVIGVAYLGSFSTVGGLEGHFASKGKSKDLVIAICFGILWVSIFLSGLN